MSAEQGDISPFPPSKVFTKRKRVTLGVAAIQIVKPNPDRVALYITNNETIDCRVDETVLPTATEGIPLDSAGGIVKVNTIEDGDLPLMEWFGIADSGTPVVRVKELIKRPKEIKSDGR